MMTFCNSPHATLPRQFRKHWADDADLQDTTYAAGYGFILLFIDIPKPMSCARPTAQAALGQVLHHITSHYSHPGFKPPATPSKEKEKVLLVLYCITLSFTESKNIGKC
jgi:hypothetical protein